MMEDWWLVGIYGHRGNERGTETAYGHRHVTLVVRLGSAAPVLGYRAF